MAFSEIPHEILQAIFYEIFEKFLQKLFRTADIFFRKSSRNFFTNLQKKIHHGFIWEFY